MFEHSNVQIAQTNFNGQTVYTFKDSVINISAGQSTRTVSFDNLVVEDSYLSFGLTFDGQGRIAADIIDNEGENLEIKFWTLQIYDYGKVVREGGSRVLYGLTFKEADGLWATTENEYSFSLMGTDIYLYDIKKSGRDSLNVMNTSQGIRGFNFSTHTVYYIADNLGKMQEGGFSVSGYDDNASKSILSGYYAGDVSSHSFFNLANEWTELSLTNLTVEKAFSVSSGSVISITAANSTATLRNVILRQNNAYSGGAAYIDNASSNLAFQGTWFYENTAISSGGAVYAKESTVDFSNQIKFSSNSAGVDGGAIFAEDAFLNFSGTNELEFHFNKADGFGGAVYLNASSISFRDNVSFSSNSAASSGGAIFGMDAFLYFYSDVNLRYNFSGADGGAFAIKNSTAVFDRSINASSNSAVGDGGAVNIENAEVRFNQGLNFVDNFAGGRGGALYLLNITSTVVFGVGITFDNNSAGKDGGALFVKGADIIFQSNISVSTNFAGGRGGAFFIEDSTVAFTNTFTARYNEAVSSGAVLYFNRTSTTFSSSFEAHQNISTGAGSAMNVNASFISMGNINASFNNSLADSGGVFNISASSFIARDSLNFSSNSAYIDGGAVNINNSYFDFVTTGKSINFFGNVAETGSGGAMNISGSTLTFDSGFTFSTNSAGGRGGAIAIEDSSVYFSTHVTNLSFNWNESGSDGGAIYAKNVDFVFDANTQPLRITFENNISSGAGGAIYAEDTNLYFSTYTEVSFKDNLANSSGTAIALVRSSAVFEAKVTFEGTKSTEIFSLIFLDASTAIFNSDVSFVGSTMTNQGLPFHAINGSSVALLGSKVSFSYFSSTSSGQGLNVGIFDNTSSLFINSTATINVLGFTAASSGGFLSVADDVKVYDFDLVLTSNTAEVGGAFFVEDGNTLVFTKSVQFSFNESKSTTSKGGAISFGEKSKLDLSSANVTAVGNVAQDGGFLFIAETTMTFNKDIGLNANRARNGGGGFYLEDSALIFNGENFVFDANESKGSGGAIYSSYSYYRSVSDKQDSFSNNNAQRTGGALYSLGSRWDFDSEQTVFSSNWSNSNGGAIWADGETFMKFNYMQAWFGENKSKEGSGGAMYVRASTIIFNNSNRTVFYANTAQGNGGAIYADNADISFDSVVTYFQSNKSQGSGGAIYATNGSSIVLRNTNLDYNSSQGAGGAAYVDNGASLNFYVDMGKAMEINGNSAASVFLIDRQYSNILNGLHLGNGGHVNFFLEAVNSIAHVVDTVSNTGSNSFNIYGNGKLYLYLGMDIDKLNINDNVSFGVQQGALMQARTLEVNAKANMSLGPYARVTMRDGGTLNVNDSATLKMSMGSGVSGSVYVAPLAKLDMNNSGYDVVTIDRLTLAGELKMESFANGTNDRILVNNSAVFMPGSQITIDNLDLTGKKYRRQYYILFVAPEEVQLYTMPTIKYDGRILYGQDNFTALDKQDANFMEGLLMDKNRLAAPTGPEVYDSHTILQNSDVLDGQTSLVLVLNGDSQYLATDFEASANSYNQRSVARLLDGLSTTLGPSKLDYMINQMVLMNGQALSEMLRDIAPYFTMNVFLSQTMDSSRSDVYNRLMRKTEYDGTIETWGRAQGALIEYGIDDNSPYKFRNVVGGMIFGLEKYSGMSDTIFGVVGKYNTNSIVQGPSDASINLYTLGGYMGMFLGDNDIKFMATGGVNTNETHRSIEALGKRADATFESYTAIADLEIGRSFDYLLDGYIVRPYIGAYANTMTLGDDVKENNAEVFSIRYNPSTFVRSAARAGVGIYGGDAIFSWNLIGGIDYVYTGAYAEMTGKLQQDSEETFSFRSVDIGKMMYNLTFNTSYSATDRIGLYIMLNYSAASRYENYSGSAGIRYFLN
jgi:predicted outer membrane repeat protein